MKRNLLRWVGKTNELTWRWNERKKNQVSSLLIACNKHLPTDIHRSIRKLDDLSYWKGSEFRTFLLYVGMVVLQPVLDHCEYQNFLTLCCACIQVMFNSYIHGCIHLYGKHTVGSNLHNLTHIVEDMLHNNVDNVNDLSTYKYENCLHILGLKLKGFKKPLESMSRRILEISNSKCHYSEHAFDPECETSPILQYPLKSDNRKFIKITLQGQVFLSSKKPGDQWFLTRSDAIVKFVHATEVNGVISLCGHALMQKYDFFKKPICSTNLSIYKSDGVVSQELFSYSRLRQNLCVWNSDQILYTFLFCTR